MKRRGFTLLEMVTVLAIVAICASIAVFYLTRNREAITVEKESVLIRARIERAQALASIAGSRMGTATRIIAPGCPAIPGYLWIEVNRGAGTVTVPLGVSYNPGTDVLTVSCEVINISTETNGLGALDPGPTEYFAFSSDGRVIVQNAPTGSVFISLRQVNAARRFGFRVLPSGVICAASDATQLRCDEELT